MSPSSEIRPTADSSPRGGQNTGPALQDFKWSPTGPQIRGDRPRIQLRGAGDSDQQRLDSTSGSTSQTTSESSSRPTLSRTVSGGRQRQSVLATAGKARTRPQISRRKSSSQKSGGPSQPKSPRLPPNNSPPARNAQEVFDTMDRLAAKGPPPGLPVPSRYPFTWHNLLLLIICARSSYEWPGICSPTSIVVAERRVNVSKPPFGNHGTSAVDYLRRSCRSRLPGQICGNSEEAG